MGERDAVSSPIGGLRPKCYPNTRKKLVSHFLEQDISELSGLKWKQKLRGFLEDKIQTEGKF